jgi:hypothetical protein
MRSPNKDNTGAPIMARPIRDVKTLAKSLVRDMTSQGFDKNDIVNLATALLDQLTAQLHTENGGD